MMKLKDLDMGIREQVDVLLLNVEERETKTGKSYTVLTVTDGDMTVEVKKWDSVLVDYEHLKNSVVRLNVKSSMYGTDLTYDADSVLHSAKPITEFIPKAPIDCKETFDKIMDRVSKMDNDYVKVLTEEILANHKEQLLYWSAAKGNHHALYGGLLYHMYRMMENADAQCDLYPTLDRNIMIAGTLLHDIGKLKELDTNELGVADYTRDGSLLGHAYIGMNMIQEYGTKLNVPTDIVVQIQHMIAAHHGNLEWGAISVPKTMEAQMLHFLDMIDSRMYMFEDTMKTMEPNKPSNKIYGLGGVSIYKF